MGEAIFNGILGALGHALSLIPLGVWFLAGVALLALVFVLRYATNWRVDAAAIVVFFAISEVLVIRTHWINLGKLQMQAQVKAAQEQVVAYKRTNELVIACYDRDPAAHVWDRSQGKCLRRDGAIE